MSTEMRYEAAPPRAMIRVVPDDNPGALSVQQLVVAQAAVSPDKRAVVCGNRSLTYQELDDASNRLAWVLKKRGMEPGALVAIALDRSPELVVALLAVLKSGSAYLPLDPGYPPQRLAHVFDNARPAVILSRPGLGEPFAATGIATIMVGTDAAGSGEFSRGAVPDTTDPEDLAYVIFTSGSTGVPKGVQIPHRALANFLGAMRTEPGITASDILVAVTTVSFDIAVLEIFLPLIAGATLVLARDDECRDGAALCRLLRRHQATILQATPITWQLLLEAGWGGAPRLKMLCGGEALPRKLAEALLACGGELWNMYGPTETTVWSSALRITSGEGPVPLGGPIANTEFYVFDEFGRLAAPGEAGELHIGGAGVALGYLGLPELTAQRFIPDPFRNERQARLYRTGDFVRVHALDAHEYRLEFLGRIDRQVKLRGFRIELGEIEATLLRHPEITQAVATIGTSPAGEPAVFAHVVLRSSPVPLSPALLVELRLELARRLPDYMHPSAIMALPYLPRMPNGKIDREALPGPAVVAEGKPGDSAPGFGSRRDVKRRLANLWSTVLGIRDIPPEASFISLGGHSLLVARLLLSIEKEFGIRLALAALFAAPTLEEQVQLLLRQEGRHYDFRQSVRLHAEGAKPPLLALHNTGVYYYKLSGLLGVDQPLTALQLFDPAIPRAHFPQSIEAVAAEYVQLLRTAQPAGPYQLLGWCVGGVLAFEVARQLEAQQQPVSFVGLIDAWAPGNLQRMSRRRAWVVSRSYRLQLIWSDWVKVIAGRQRFTDFLDHREAVRSFLRMLGKRYPEPPPVTAENRHASREHYDQWLDGYLEGLVARYAPKPYSGRVTLLSSASEPRGWFLNPLMGWSPFVPAGIDTIVLDGDHFTVFEGRGLEKMATTIRAILSGLDGR